MRSIIICLFIMLVQTSIAATGDENQPKEPNRLKVGLVLGGGGAKGAATVGVLKAIEEVGIPIDYIAGTSIGAIVGGLWACGIRSEELEDLFRSQEWSSLLTDRHDAYKNQIWAEEDGVTYIFGFPINRKNKKEGNKGRKTIGLVHGDKIFHLIDSLSGFRDSISFDSLPIPFRCVAFDFITGREVVLDYGKLPTAMRASMAIPGLFKPVVLDSMVLVDGGVCNNLPVDVVKAMGADVVIAIDLTQNKHDDQKDKNMWNQLSLDALTSFLLTGSDKDKYDDNCTAADVYINPRLDGCDALSFQQDKINQMILIGEKTGKKHRKALKKLKKKVFSEYSDYSDNLTCL